jgi:NAD(P)-dependent dehydrogenase (short-subunit alcohol dehydrogenase family)
MLLKDKHAVIYGAAGAVGSAVARTFAREGATVHLTGRDPVRLAPFEIVSPTFVQLGRDVAIVGGETTLTGVADGEHFTQRLRYADTFHRRQGRWRVRHVQVTEIR